MKKICYLLIMMLPSAIFAQSDFSPEDYMEFREQNKNLTTDQLLEQYPARTTYYSHRQYEMDLNSIPWFDSIDAIYKLTGQEKSLLRKNNFMVSERLSDKTWIGSLSQIYTDDLPLFLSSDLILFTLHQSYDEILKTIEIRILEPNLGLLLDAMDQAFVTLYTEYSGTAEMADALADVDLYLAVARSLLTNETIKPRFADPGQYNTIMAAIDAETMVRIPLFTRSDLPRKVDFSQFKPRGHYTDEYYSNGELCTQEDYFRAMMWLGRIDFLLTPPPKNPWEENMWKDEDIMRMDMAALLLNEVLNSSGKKDLLDFHEKVIGFLVGPDDNLNPDELKAVSSASLENITDVLDPETFGTFTDQLNSSDDYGQKIMSNFFFVDPDTIAPGTLPISFRLLGQKFLVDSYILSEVVFDRLVYNNEKVYRMMPDPLDVMSVLGNEDAMALMKEEMEYYKYAYKVNELKYLVDAYDDEFWEQSLYNTWLDAIRGLNPPESATGLPYFMQTTAWHHEKLNTQLTSWTQLRHDNILYGKQSYTGGTGCSFPHTYVEPYPDFYGKLETFASNASDFFSEILAGRDEVLANYIPSFYDNYSLIMGKLEAIAIKEIKGETLDESQVVFLKTMINGYMSSGPSVSGWINDILFDSYDKWDKDYTVADVHTQPTEADGTEVGKILHVGNGKLNLGVFIAPNPSNPKELICYTGPVSSFHTVTKLNYFRYNDDEWEALFLESDTAFSARPGWAYHYLADNSGDTILPDRVLDGTMYTGTGDLNPVKEPVDYLITFPNPASDMVHLRFVLRDGCSVNVKMFDLQGRLIREIYNGKLESAEHDLPVSLENVSPGMYIVLLEAGIYTYPGRIIVR